VLDLLGASRERSWETLLATQGDSWAAQRAAAAGAAVCALELFRPGAFAASRRTLDRWLRDAAPDVVHVHGNRAAVFVGPLVERHGQVRFHYTVHGYHFEHRTWARRLLGRWLERRVSAPLRSRVFVCDYDLALARRRRLMSPHATARVIYNGVDPTRLEQQRSARRDGVVWVGRLVPQKDPELLAEIAAGVIDRGYPVRIVGSGPGEGLVRRRLAGVGEERGRLTGGLTREDALVELSRARLLILPSRWEGLPLVVLEAMALGVPVLAAPVGGVPEAIEDGDTGWLIDSREPDDWVEAIATVLADEPLCKEVAERARRRFEERFTWSACWQAHVELWTGSSSSPSA
jgi:glycosyltransferase involved in cell wall biosynthesis